MNVALAKVDADGYVVGGITIPVDQLVEYLPEGNVVLLPEGVSAHDVAHLRYVSGEWLPRDDLPAPDPEPTPEEQAAALLAQQLAATRLLIHAERDRRIALGFDFMGKRYDFDVEAKSRITGAATLAGFAMGAGAQPGNLFWHGGAYPFVWIAHDNSLTEMDAPTCFGFGQAAAAHETMFIFASRSLKDLGMVEDFTDDVWWPA